MKTRTPSIPQANWTVVQKIALRFFFIFLGAFIFFDPNGIFPTSRIFSRYYAPLLYKLISWLTLHIYKIKQSFDVFPNGSGDTTYNYLWLLTIVLFSLCGTLIWSVIDRKTKNYYKLYFLLWVAVRYYVALTMLVYGSVKVIKLQFPAPSAARLLEPIGNMSPMGLAWTYMGYSTGFNIFTGLAELSCGFLLLFRRTSTLGAIIGLAVAGNIMAINYAFDVPVKIISTMLVCMCLFMLFKDYTRLINFFFLNRETRPANITPPKFKARWINIVLIVVKYTFITITIYNLATGAIQQSKIYGDDAPKPKFYGVYNVQYFIRGHDTLPPLLTDGTRWRRLMIGAYKNATIALMNDNMKMYNLRADTTSHLFTMTTTDDLSDKLFLNYQQLKPDTLLLSGVWRADSIKVKLVRFDAKKFPLNQGRFHWISEYPNNQ